MPSDRPSRAAFAATIRGLCLERGIKSQDALARKLGYKDGGLVSKWMRGHQDLEDQSVEKLSAVFEQTPDEFMARVWRVHRALRGEPEPGTEPVPDGSIEIRGYGERHRIADVSHEQMVALVTSLQAMARPGGD